jgi:ribosomal protein S18 acetylase RimI-like enzyme
MAVLASTHTERTSSGPRRLEPASDLSEVADLIEEAFSEDLDREGYQVLGELRQLGRWGILLGMLKFISPELEDILSGFVWEEDGHIVGNVSVNIITHRLSHWRISNVAVALPFRQKGIARSLMEATVDFIDERGGRKVYLQVRDDNTPALKLYESLDFRSVTAETEMYLPNLPSVPELSTPVEFQPRPLRSNESTAVYALALSATPKSNQRLTPINQIDFETDWIQSLSDGITALTTGKKVYRFVVDGASKLAAYLQLTTARRGGSPHRLQLLVQPEYEGRVEPDLIRFVLGILAHHHSQAEIQIRLNAEKQKEIEGLESCGFLKRRTLITMELTLQP